MTRKPNIGRAAISGAVLLLASFHASAAMETYDFYKLTSTNTENLGSQLTITVWDSVMANSEFSLSLESTDIFFTVQNDVDNGFAGNVAEVYFDDGLFGPSVAFNSLGGFTSFTGGGATPSELPAGNTASPPFVASQEFSADVDSGSPSKGVDASADILGIKLGLGSFADFADVNDAILSGDLRFGLHVRSIGAAGLSDSYINNPEGLQPPNEVPLPAAAWLFGTGLLGLAGISRRKKAQAS